MKNLSLLLTILLLTLSISSCDLTNNSKSISSYDEAVSYSIKKLKKSLNDVSFGKYPKRTKGIGEWDNFPPSEWTSGFFPGCLWIANKLNADSTLFNNAVKFTEGMTEQQFNTNTHDVGFMIFCSYGNAYAQTKNEKYKEVILNAANSLSKRFNPIVGCIQSWNGDFQVIIDNMMNLELLMWASKNGGDQSLRDIAISHADKTIENHLREDGSSFHVVIYDTANGNVLQRKTHQGYADSSAWARGQAWGIYGFTMMYRETKDKKYLETAEKMAKYFIDNLPNDFIPYWDFNLPDNYEKDFRDASAATIALSAFLELRNYVNDKNIYDATIKGMYNALLSDYISVNTSSSGIINHCAYNVNSSNPFDWDASTSWGDYYFLEALERYKDFN